MSARAACADLTVLEADRLFFNRAHQERARALCEHCPLAKACLDIAIKAEGRDPAGYRFGVFGATTGVERAAAVGASTYVFHQHRPGRADRRRAARLAATS